MKKVLLFSSLVLLLVLFIVGVFHLRPPNTLFNQSLDFVKTDESGSPSGTTEEVFIKITNKDYWFQDDRYDISVSSFDNLKTIVPSTDSNGSATPDKVTDICYHNTFAAFDAKNNHIWVYVYYSPDYEYWAIATSQQDYYVASASGTHTAQEVFQYFDGLLPSYQAE